jgi:hypothetical protein
MRAVLAREASVSVVKPETPASDEQRACRLAPHSLAQLAHSRRHEGGRRNTRWHMERARGSALQAAGYLAAAWQGRRQRSWWQDGEGHRADDAVRSQRPGISAGVPVGDPHAVAVLLDCADNVIERIGAPLEFAAWQSAMTGLPRWLLPWGGMAPVTQSTRRSGPARRSR